MSRHDLILVGGGLASGLLAWRLGQVRPGLSVLVLERDARPGGNHTWCFHASDLTADQCAWLDPFVVRTWDDYDVVFPGHRRRVGLGYRMVTSDRFAAVLDGRGSLRCGVEVTGLAPGRVTLASGEVLEAAAVVDGRGFTAADGLVLARQTFLGQEVRLAHPHGLVRPVLMDATVEQVDGYRFLYLLPLSETDLLAEDTYYTDRPLDLAAVRTRLAASISARGWTVGQVLREERGSLPITLDGNVDAFWRAADPEIARIGMRAGLFHPTTGYSLPDAVRLADHVTGLADLSGRSLAAETRSWSVARWRSQGFYRMLNRMLFRAGPAEGRFRILRRFYGLPEPTIARFYAGRLTLADKVRLLAGRPPVPVLQALRALPTARRLAA